MSSVATHIKVSFRAGLIMLGRLLARLLFNVQLRGVENIPAEETALIVIANHFSWFDAPLLSLLLPFSPSFLVATESLRLWWVRSFVNIFDGIPVWRGQPDRRALHRALDHLAQRRPLGIFPEGGMDPEMAERIARGEQVHELRGHFSRRNARISAA